MNIPLALNRPTTTVPLCLFVLVIGLTGLILIFWPECRAAVQVWTDSTAYGHCYLVAPISCYLAWERRDRLVGMLPRPTSIASLLGIPLGMAWFIAERLGIMEGRQLVALSFVELMFLVVLGWRLFRILLAPLLYLVFLVPFGAFITPALQGFTAHFIDAGLNILGVSHFANEMVIEISAGTFFVAEACAGLRFLIAAVAFGVFYALLNYRSTGRRIIFIAISIIVPIIANGFRALGIVLLGYYLGSAEAAAADHIIYGWVFFSLVMLLLVLIGLPLREGVEVTAVVRNPPTAVISGKPWAAAAVLLLAGIPSAIASSLQRNMPPPVLAASPVIQAPANCSVVKTDIQTDRAYATIHCGDRTWGYTIRAVSARSTGSALAEIRNTLAGALGAEDATTMPLHGTAPDAGRWQLLISREPELVVATAAWVHGRPAPGGLTQRIMQARDSVLGNDLPPILIALSTRPTRSLSEGELESTVAELNRILAAQPDLDVQVERLTGVRGLRRPAETSTTPPAGN